MVRDPVKAHMRAPIRRLDIRKLSEQMFVLGRKQGIATPTRLIEG